MAAVGGGAGLTVAPVTNLMVRAASAAGLSMETASDQLATVSTLAFSLGAATGPLSAGAAVQLLGGPYDGFRWATTCLGLGLWGLGVILAPIFLWDRCRASQLAAPVEPTAATPGGVIAPARAQTGISDPLLPADSHSPPRRSASGA